MKIEGDFVWKFGLAEVGPVQFTEHHVTPGPSEGTGKLVAVVWQVSSFLLSGPSWMGTLFRVEPDATLCGLYELTESRSEMDAKRLMVEAILAEAAYQRTGAPMVEDKA